MKKIRYAIVLLFITFISFGFVKEVRAEREIPEERLLPRLVDDADVLTSEEEEKILKKLDRVSERLQYDIVIHTVRGAKYETMEQYTDDYFDYNGFGFGEKGSRTGMVLALDFESRDWHISTGGEAIWALSNSLRKKMVDAFMPYLSNDMTYRGFDKFIDLAEEVILAHEKGEEPVITKDSDLPEASHTDHNASGEVVNKPKKENTLMRILIGVVVGIVLALLVVGILTSQLNTVRAETNAGKYEVKGSFALNESRDFFLYKTVSKSKKSSSSSSGGSSVHRSSSGSSHGGGGGKF